MLFRIPYRIARRMGYQGACMVVLRWPPVESRLQQEEMASNDWARPPAAQSRPQLGVEACTGPFQVA